MNQSGSFENTICIDKAFDKSLFVADDTQQLEIIEVPVVEAETFTCTRDNTIVEQMIREAAYYKWVNAGYPENRHEEFWIEAEKEYFENDNCQNLE